MALVPWTTDTGEILRDNNGEIIYFFVEGDLDFLTLPLLTIDIGLLYNYDIVVFGATEIEAIIKPSELSFNATSDTTSTLSGIFNEVGNYDVELVARNQFGIEKHQNFTIVVTDKYKSEDVDEDERFNSLGEGLLVLFEEVS